MSANWRYPAESGPSDPVRRNVCRSCRASTDRPARRTGSMCRRAAPLQVSAARITRRPAAGAIDENVAALRRAAAGSRRPRSAGMKAARPPTGGSDKSHKRDRVATAAAARGKRRLGTDDRAHRPDRRRLIPRHAAAQQAGHGNGREQADDRDHDQQLDQRESHRPLTDLCAPRVAVNFWPLMALVCRQRGDARESAPLEEVPDVDWPALLQRRRRPPCQPAHWRRS